MKKISSLVYSIFIALFKITPFKFVICSILKKYNYKIDKYYTDLKFRGKFRVDVSNSENFYLFHHGGTIENEIFWKGLFKSWESDTGWIWLELARVSTNIVDIGANTGVYSMVAKAVNSSSNVFAFEPSNHTYNKLLKNNEINGFDIKCYQIALSNVNGNQIFYDTPDSNQTSASLSSKKLKEWEGYNGQIIEYKIQTETLKSFFERNKLESVDLIKIDIEMHEPEAIEGLGNDLLKLKPVIIIEVLSQNVADQLNTLIDLTQFELFHLHSPGKAIKKEIFEVNQSLWNYLLFHKDKIDFIKQNTTVYN